MTKKLNNMIVLVAYPIFKVIDIKSPAVSPRVVAQIFIIQNARVMSATFFALLFIFWI